MIKGVIFDMDGLLIDSEVLTYKLYKKAFIEHGKSLEEEFYFNLLGTNEAFIKGSIEKVFSSEAIARAIISQVHGELNKIFEEEGVPVKSGVIELINYLEANNIKKAVATSSSHDRAFKILTSCSLMKHFDVIVCGDEVEESKPNPEIFLNAAQKLNLASTGIIVFEDSENGIKGANAGNMISVNVPDLKKPSDYIHENADLIIKNLQDAIPYIKTLNL